MSPVPQLDWPKDLYATPWKDVSTRAPEPAFDWVTNILRHGKTLLAIAVMAPCLLAVWVSF